MTAVTADLCHFPLPDHPTLTYRRQGCIHRPLREALAAALSYALATGEQEGSSDRLVSKVMDRERMERWVEGLRDAARTLPDPDALNEPFATCPLCGGDRVARLTPDWTAKVERGVAIPIVGCGNPWHYQLDHEPVVTQAVTA